MHICCAPCFVAPFYRLRDDFDITGFWFNHNIHPVTEYRNRLECVKNFINQEKLEFICLDEYGLLSFMRKALLAEDNKCFNCYYDRLDKVASYAKSGDFDYFSTSLLYSKRQNHDLIKEIGFNIANKHGVEFFYQDFREYWQEGIDVSKAKGMYRQRYCGCIISEMERNL